MEVLEEILKQKLKKKQSSAYQKPLREFEMVKRTKIVNKNKLKELKEEILDNKIRVSKYKNQIKHNRQTVCIDAELMKSFFWTHNRHNCFFSEIHE